MNFGAVISFVEHLVPIFLSFYIGSWSDKYGRKPFLAACMIGKLLGSVGDLLAGIWLDQINRWTWLALSTPVQSVLGGKLAYIMMTYSFIADNSTPR